MKRIIIALGLSLFVGCGNPKLQTPPPVVGLPDSFDTKILKTLGVAQAGIEALRPVVVKDFPQFKDQMNGLITSYKVAMNAYKVYHLSLSPSLESNLQIQVNGLVASIASLTAQVGK